jgi:hypothetical protein
MMSRHRRSFSLPPICIGRASRVLSGRLGLDTLLAEPGERSTRQVNNILCQAVDHHHEDIGADRGKNVPPAVEFQHEAPRHSNGTLPRRELGTIDEIQLPEKVAEKEANCALVSVFVTVRLSRDNDEIPAPNTASLLRFCLSSDLSTRLLINDRVRPMTSKMRNRNVSSCTTCSFM